ncbi:MAG: polysaccharide deacetylase family protein [Alicyclobacillaceae bacterium]|nr:polysaccharide deacetylase family protein [Alicyclobacillaceae bacterium]
MSSNLFRLRRPAGLASRLTAIAGAGFLALSGLIGCSRATMSLHDPGGELVSGARPADTGIAAAGQRVSSGPDESSSATPGGNQEEGTADRTLLPVPDPQALARLTLSGPAVPILMYHSISRNPSNPLCKDPRDFAQEMEWLASSGFTAVTFADVFRAWAGQGTLPPKPVVITFDDGYKDNITAAYPILKQLGLRATLFVVVNFIDKPNFVSWDDLVDAEKSGVFDVESHGVDHVDFTALSPAQLAHQLQDSKAILEQHLHKRVYVLCYPSGRFNAAVEAAARNAGYLMAVTTRPGWANPAQGLFSLHRVRVSGGETLLAFESQLGISSSRAVAAPAKPAPGSPSGAETAAGAPRH